MYDSNFFGSFLVLYSELLFFIYCLFSQNPHRIIMIAYTQAVLGVLANKLKTTGPVVTTEIGR